jgi:hypothetical protein
MKSQILENVAVRVFNVVGTTPFARGSEDSKYDYFLRPLT